MDKPHSPILRFFQLAGLGFEIIGHIVQSHAASKEYERELGRIFRNVPGLRPKKTVLPLTP
jgi:hypothetical protein